MIFMARRKKSSIKCSFCGKVIRDITWICRRCQETLCGNCRLPEDHKCKGTPKEKSFFTKIAKTPKYERYDKGDYEMYKPKSKGHSFSFPKTNVNVRGFFRKYIKFRVQDKVKPHLMQFLLIFIIGVVLNYIYYQTFSLNYLFIGGVNEWFAMLQTTLNYGVVEGYNLLYLMINGIYYLFFYYAFALTIFTTITTLNKRDTWVMLGWFAVIIYLVTKFLPQIA